MSVIFPMAQDYVEPAATDVLQHTSGEEALSPTHNKALCTQILEEMRKKPSISQTAIANRLNVGRSTVQRAVKTMIEAGLIIRSGGKFNGKWVIKHPRQS